MTTVVLDLELLAVPGFYLVGVSLEFASGDLEDDTTIPETGIFNHTSS